jgi:GEVED domain/Pregnancy-associated plasma protein-A
MRSLIIAYFLFCVTIVTYGQNEVINCGNQKLLFEPYPLKEPVIIQREKLAMGGTAFVPIKLHIVRNSDGTTSFDWEKFMTVFTELNKYYLPIDVQFYLTLPVQYIDNTAYYEFNADFEEDDLCNANDVTNAVNVYFTNSIIFGYGFNASGYAYYPSTIAQSNRVFLTNNSSSSVRTMAHELGHYFNLLHTFQDNNAPAPYRELVTRGSGANCLTTGDFVCDTHADPYGLSGATTSGCNYIGTATDANGQLFTPNMDNMMSYYNSTCGNVFTVEQHSRLDEGFLLRNSPSNQYSINYSDIGVASPTNLTGSFVSSGIQLSYTDNSTNELGFIIERSTNMAGPFEAVAGVVSNTTSYMDNAIISNTTYYYRVRNAHSATYSNIVEVTTGSFYCTPTYSFSCSSYPVVIEQFSIASAGLSNINSGCSANNYGKFTHLTATVTKGQSYSFTASATRTTNTPYYLQHLAIWIDFNQNGLFDSSEKVYGTTASAGLNPAVTATITIPNTTATGLTSLRVRSQYFYNGMVNDPCNQLVMGETEDYSVMIQDNDSLNTITTSSFLPTTVCAGDTISVTFTTSGSGFSGSTTYKVQMAQGNGSFIDLVTIGNSSPLQAIIPSGTTSETNYKIRVVSSSPSITGSTATNDLTILGFPTVPTIAVLNNNLNQCSGTNTTLEASNCTNGTIVWNTGQIGNSILITIDTAFQYRAKCVNNNCESAYSAPIQFSCPANPEVAINLDIKVLLEGCYDATTQKMKTVLNQRGLLPGQTPISSFGVPTPSGHPYSIAPWNYTGTETISSYAPDIVDWVLVTIKTNPVNAIVFRTAALLKETGEIQLVSNNPVLDTTKAYYIQVEHRNHLGVMSSTAMPVQNRSILCNFKTANSYIAPNQPSYGQKFKSSVYQMFVGDIDKSNSSQNFDINFSDISKLRSNSGKFERYLREDINLDADINFLDLTVWRTNSGIFSSVPH